jgi:hypothetical protein
MKLVRLAGLALTLWAATGWLVLGEDRGKAMPLEALIADLSSADGAKRVAATAELFRRGKAVLPELKKAGAKQVAPVGATIDGTRRLDMVYSVLEGFPPNPPKARAGYRTDTFGLHVEKGTTPEDVQKMCRDYGCTLAGKFNPESRPSCYLQIGQGKSLEEVIRQLLCHEPKVTTINLNYFDA